MKNKIKFSLPVRISLGYVIITLFAIINAIVGIVLLSRVHTIDKDITEVYLTSSQNIKEIANYTRSSNTLGNAWIFQPNQKDKALLKQICDTVLPKLFSQTDVILNNVDNRECHQIYNAIEKNTETFLADCKKIMAILKIDDDYVDDIKVDRALDIYTKNVEPVGKKNIEDLNLLLSKIEKIKAELTNEKERAYTTLKYSFILLAILLVIIGFTATFLTIRHLTSLIGGEPQEVFEMANKISKGDLTFQIRDEDRGKKGIYGAMIRMTEELIRAISAVSQSSESIAEASKEMSSSAQLMSNGSTEQASSVEEISSSMEQMVANIQQNTNNSKQTEKIAKESAKDINEGNESVANTVNSMMTIANKISIIEEISRQTNLLALNAAVEAARAGEHGRGFAVVAAEVRKLAEKSQEAATEINQVSSKSVEIAKRSGELLQSIVPNIQKTSDLVQEITSASIEQNSGATQINSAIQQLNLVVQSNAATSEEMAASAQELSTQSDYLKQSVAFFKINSDALIQSSSFQENGKIKRSQTDNNGHHKKTIYAKTNKTEKVKNEYVEF